MREDHANQNGPGGDNTSTEATDSNGPAPRAAEKRPPRGELLTNDSAKAMWGAFEALPEGLKAPFAELATAHVAVPEQPTRRTPGASLAR